MGIVVDMGGPRRRREPRRGWGLVTRLVDAEQPSGRRPVRGRKGVVHLGDIATVCIVEDVPSVGDLIGGIVPAVVEKVRVTREGRVVIHARALD